MVTSDWDKFCLLLWKNWRIQWNRKKQLLYVMFLGSGLFVAILLVLRVLVNPEKSEGPSRYEPEDINSFKYLQNMTKYPPNTTMENIPLRWELIYTPQNVILDEIMKDAANNLNLTLVPAKDAQNLEEYILKTNAIAGVQFDDGLKDINTYPKKMNYFLRFPSESRTRSNDKQYVLNKQSTWVTNIQFPPYRRGGPRNGEDNDGGAPPGYVAEGFLTIQNAIASAFIRKSSNTNEFPKIQMQRYPYPASVIDEFLLGLESLLPLVILLSFYFFFKYTIAHVSEEKELQLKEVMNLMGVSNWLHWTAWFIKSILLVVIPCGFTVFLLKVPMKDGVAVLNKADWSVLLFYLFVISIALITFSFLLSTIFAKADTAVVLCGLILFISHLPFGLNANQYDNIQLREKLALCIFVGSALGFGFKLIVRLEGTEEGLQWSNLWEPMNVDDDMHVGYTIIIMLIMSVVHMIIALYLEQIFPGEYGVAKKWYFPFTKEFWCGLQNYKGVEDTQVTNSTDLEGFETEIADKNVGLEIRNLRKTFYDKAAVKGLTMNLFEDEITILLGHNGAGKTTTISMLTGMLPPTSGTAIINGCDIRRNLKGARTSLALCPQHNILFTDLTVKEHIIFYSRLKGIKGNRVDSQIKKYVKNLDMENKLNTKASSLSGGMQRKLSVGVALCGASKVVLLDEPSSGMDPAARRSLWNLLQSEKKGRTILLTTHLMEEADVLGDRIAIMSTGVLKCFGTSFFLKKKFGAGYHLICEKRIGCKSENITTLLAKYIPDIQIESEVGSELSYKLSENHVSVFKQMLADLETFSEDLNLSGYGVSNTSLEEVFMVVGTEDSEKDTELPNDVNKNFKSITDDNNAIFLKGYRLIWNQWRAMFLKKYLNSLRNWPILLILNIMPIVFIILTIYVSKTYSDKPLAPLEIAIQNYYQTVTVLEKSANLKDASILGKIATEYTKQFENFGSNHELVEITQKFGSYIEDLYGKYLVRINRKYMVAATITGSEVIGWFNNQAYHTAPLSLNLIHNAIARAVLGKDCSIELTNFPLPYTAGSRFLQLDSVQNVGFQLALNLSFMMTFTAAYFAMFLIRERASRAKLLQFVTGVNTYIFWLSALIWDFVVFTVTSLIIIITFICIQEEGWSSPGEIGRIFLILLLFEFCVLPFVYAGSFAYKEPLAGFTYLANIFILTGIVVYVFVVVLSLEVFGKKDVTDAISWVAMLIPHFTLARSIQNLNIVSQTKKICDDFCALMPFLCENRNILCQQMPKCCSAEFFSVKAPGIGTDLLYFLVEGFILFAIVMILEFRWHTKSCCVDFKKRRSPTLTEEDIDVDVKREKEKVQNVQNQELQGHNLVLDRVTKFYKSFLAVNQISLAVRSSECFGLLGVNGAGKTSAFKMIIGDEKITSGRIFVKGIDLKKHQASAYKEMGYCPQFEALLPDLTCRETLRIYCWLRGVPDDKCENVINELAEGLGFTKHLDKRVKRCSGGTKRKVSTAGALVGNPSVICLDEPSTGMDPGARRHLWNKICQIRDAGRSIILTSHSMEECEALCTRIAIMVNGEFKCIGSLQRLKNRFSKGIVLKIKLKKLDEQDKLKENMSVETTASNKENYYHALEAYFDVVKDFIQLKFPDATVKEQYNFLITFYIPFTGIKWSEIFGLMEANKKKLNIEDYSISQTTLEEIFLDFAKDQLDK